MRYVRLLLSQSQLIFAIPTQKQLGRLRFMPVSTTLIRRQLFQLRFLPILQVGAAPTYRLNVLPLLEPVPPIYITLIHRPTIQPVFIALISKHISLLLFSLFLLSDSTLHDLLLAEQVS